MCWVAAQVFSWRHGAVAVDVNKQIYRRKLGGGACEWTSPVGLFYLFNHTRIIWRRTFCLAPVRCPRDDGTLLPSLCPPPRPVPTK